MLLRCLNRSRTIQEGLVKSGLPSLVFAQLIYAIDYEMAATPVDFFHRRTGAILFDIDVVREWKNEVIQYMALKFEWNEEQIQAYTQELDEALTEATTPADF